MMKKQELDIFMQIIMNAAHKMVVSAQEAEELRIDIETDGASKESSVLLAQMVRQGFLDCTNALVTVYHMLDSIVDAAEDGDVTSVGSSTR